MIHVVTNTKGGVGKSLIAYHLFGSEAARHKKEFEIIELDAKNDTSAAYHRSKILTGKCKTLTLEYADEAVGEAIYQSIVQNKEVIIDVGGGRDTDEVLKSLAATGEEIRYYVPLISTASQLKNLVDTYDLIEKNGGKPNLIINHAKGWDAATCGAVDIYGDGTYEPKNTILKRTAEVFFLPESPYFGYAERENELIGDFIVMGNQQTHHAKSVLFKLAREEAAEGELSEMQCFSRLWANWQEIRKAYEFYQKIARQDFMGFEDIICY